MGGSSRFITILQGGGGASRDPKFVLRNIWTAPNEYYDYDRKILRTSETKRSENIDNIVSKNESSKSFKVNKKGQYVLNEESAPWPK